MTPRKIYQTYIDAVSICLWDGDAEGVARAMEYPHVIHLPDGDRVISDPAGQHEDTAAFRASLESLGATAFHRSCREARVDPGRPDRIVGVHTTYIMRGGSYLTAPYECTMSLVRGADGTWRADAIRVSVCDPALAYYRSDTNPRAPGGQTGDD